MSNSLMPFESLWSLCSSMTMNDVTILPIFTFDFIHTEKELKKQQKAAAAAEKKAAQEAAKANGTANSSDKNWTSCNFTTGVDLVARDQHSINEHVNVSVESMIG